MLAWGGNSHTSPLFRKAAVLKFKDKINLENTLFVSKSMLKSIWPYLTTVP